jgi:hypothetical protein
MGIERLTATFPFFIWSIYSVICDQTRDCAYAQANLFSPLYFLLIYQCACAHIPIWEMPRHAKKQKNRKPLNLSIDVKITQKVKIEAIKEGKRLSEITEILYLKFLKKKGVPSDEEGARAEGKNVEKPPDERKIGFYEGEQMLAYATA